MCKLNFEICLCIFIPGNLLSIHNICLPFLYFCRSKFEFVVGYCPGGFGIHPNEISVFCRILIII